jgi:hypothetical protein
MPETHKAIITIVFPDDHLTFSMEVDRLTKFETGITTKEELEEIPGAGVVGHRFTSPAFIELRGEKDNIVAPWVYTVDENAANAGEALDG